MAIACAIRAPTLIKERGEDGLLGIDAIAETYWHIHRQPRSAWTQESTCGRSRKRSVDAVSASLGSSGPTGL
jgi:hypothetical protein